AVAREEHARDVGDGGVRESVSLERADLLLAELLEERRIGEERADGLFRRAAGDRAQERGIHAGRLMRRRCVILLGRAGRTRRRAAQDELDVLLGHARDGGEPAHDLPTTDRVEVREAERLEALRFGLDELRDARDPGALRPRPEAL